MFLQVECIFDPKTSQKPFQNEVRDLQKSMLKTPCFSTSIFSRHGLDFGASLASKIEPSSPFWLQKTRNGAPFEPSSIKCLLKMASWRPRASNLEPLGSILEGFGFDFGGFGMLQSTFLRSLNLLLACCLKDLWVPQLGSPADNCGDAFLPSLDKLLTVSNTT